MTLQAGLVEIREEYTEPSAKPVVEVMQKISEGDDSDNFELALNCSSR